MRLKTDEDISCLRESGRILSNALRFLRSAVREGMRLSELDVEARKLIAEAGAEPAFLGYKPEGAKRPYPAAICTSVNDVVVHGVPSRYALRSGDVLKIDCGVSYKGYITDAAVTVGIGEITEEEKLLIATTEKALQEAIKVCKPGARLGDIGWVIEKIVTGAGFSVIKALTGHGVGFALHEEPTVYNYGEQGTGIELKPGMVLAIEPMVAAGGGDVIENKDGSFRTRDGSLTAQFEHTLAVIKGGCEVLTPI